jgi:hypothetical protein
MPAAGRVYGCGLCWRSGGETDRRTRPRRLKSPPEGLSGRRASVQAASRGRVQVTGVGLVQRMDVLEGEAAQGPVEGKVRRPNP